MADSTVDPTGGGDFTGLAAALSDGGTGAGDTITIVDEDWTSFTDTTEAVVVDDNITIVAVGQARHAGFYNGTTNWELNTSGNNHSLTVSNTGCKLDGLVIVQSGSGNSDECVRMGVDGGTLTVVDSVLRCNSNNVSDQDCLYAGNLIATVNCENVIAIGAGRAGFNAQNFQTTGTDTHDWDLISCVAWDCGGVTNEADGGGFVAHARATSSITTVDCHNCWAIGNGGGHANSHDYSNFSGTAQGTRTWNIDNCIDGDSNITTLDGGAVNAHEGYVVGESDTADAQGDVLVNDITSAPFDLRLQDDANNDAQDDHANATGAGLTFGDYVGSSVDIAGTVRPQNTDYDIGAFEVVAAGGTVTFIVGLDGSATLVPNLSLTASFIAGLDGAADLAPNFSITADLIAAFDGSADLVDTLTPLRGLTAAFGGTADLVASMTPIRGFTAAFDGSAILVPDLSLIAALIADMNGSAALVSDLSLVASFVAAFDGTADLVSDIETVSNAIELAIALAGSADLVADVLVLRRFTASFDGSAALLADATVLRNLVATFTASADMIASLINIKGFTAAFDGTATLVSDLTLLRGFVAGLTATATLLPDLSETLVFGTDLNGSAIFTASLTIPGEAPVIVRRTHFINDMGRMMNP